MVQELHHLIEQAKAALAAADWERVGQVCRKMKALPGGQAEAQHWQALMAVKQGDAKEGVRLLRMVVRQKPGHGVAARQLAQLLAHGRDFAGAAEVLRGQLAVDGGDMESLLLLAEMERDAGEFDQLEARIAALEAVNNILNVRLLGWLWRCTSEHPEQWPDANALALKNPLPGHRAQMWFWLMIKAWLLRLPGDLDTAMDGLRMALKDIDVRAMAVVPGSGEQAGKVKAVYAAYLDMLREMAPVAMPPAPEEGAKRVWLVGDSHSVSSHGQVVVAGGVRWQMETRLVVGVKYWHVATPHANRHGALLRHWLAKLPEGEPVLLSMGEIDVRETEGMWRQVLRGRGVEEVVQSTLVGGLVKLKAMVDEVCPGREVWLSGIPQRMPGRVYTMEPEQRDTYIAMRERARDVLAEASATHGFGVVDLWNATGEEGAFLKDALHLKPEVLPAAWAAAKGGKA